MGQKGTKHMSNGADQGRNPYTGEPVGPPVPHTTEAELEALSFALSNR